MVHSVAISVLEELVMHLRTRLYLPCIILLVASSTVIAQPDAIFHHGKIVTVDSAFSIAQAIAVRGDRIQDVGPDDKILKLAGPQTVLVDLRGRTIIPG